MAFWKAYPANKNFLTVLGRPNKKLLKLHRSEWVEFWNSFRIRIEDNLELVMFSYYKTNEISKKIQTLGESNLWKSLLHSQLITII